MEGLKVVKERRKSSITKKKKKSDSSNNGNDRHNNSNKKEASASLDINIAAAAASLNEHGEKSRRSGKGNSSSRGKSPNNVASSEEESNDVVPPLPLNGRKKTASKSIQKDGPRRMSKSVGGMVEEHDFSQYVSDSDSNEENDVKKQAPPKDHYINNGGKKNAHNTERESFKKLSRGINKLQEGEDEDNSDADDDNYAVEREGDKNIPKEKSFSPTPVVPTPRRAATSRRAALSQSVGPGTMSKSQWKPLSEPVSKRLSQPNSDSKEDDEEQAGDTGGIGGLWNKFTSKLSGGTEVSAASTISLEPRKIDGSKYFRRGKRRAEKCQFLEAVALFNFALVRQREDLGKNHIDCGRTLNEIGLCWMMLGERYPAMSAFEEALYIMQKNLGDGAEEVAEVTNNIWMVLHEQREEARMAQYDG
jgi:hypothetical protein